MKRPEYQVVETPRALDEACRVLSGAGPIALDLEADTLFHYGETACLAQLCDGARIWLVDLVRLAEISPLKPLLEDPAVEKVLHGGDYDIRLLRRHFGIDCRPVFDTELAARFLGARRSGLSEILAERFGVVLSKKFQKHDWTRRPLPEEMRFYAAADVNWLLPLAAMMKEELAALGRLEWVEEECRLLAASTERAREPGPLFLSFRGAELLDSRRLAVLEALLQAREKLAAERDRPPFKVLTPEAIRRIVAECPENDRDLARIDGLGRRSTAFRAILLAALGQALKLPAGQLPAYPRRGGRRRARDPRFHDLVRALKRWRVDRAAGLGLDVSIICANSVLEELAEKRPLAPGALDGVERLREWQKREFGAEISGLIAAAGAGAPVSRAP